MLSERRGFNLWLRHLDRVSPSLSFLVCQAEATFPTPGSAKGVMGPLVYIQNIKNLREIAFSRSLAHSVALAIFLIQSQMNGPLYARNGANNTGGVLTSRG